MSAEEIIDLFLKTYPPDNTSHSDDGLSLYYTLDTGIVIRVSNHKPYHYTFEERYSKSGVPSSIMCLVFENEPSENNPNLKDPRTEPFELSQIVYELWNGVELSEKEVLFIIHSVMKKGTAFQDKTNKGILSVVPSQIPPLFVQLRKYNVPKKKYKDVGKWEGYSTIEKAKYDIEQFIADNPIPKDIAYTYMIMSKYAVDWKTGEDKYNMLYLIGQCTQQIGRIIGIKANEYLPNYKKINESKTIKNMKKNTIRLNENTLKQIIAESVKKVLKEYEDRSFNSGEFYGEALDTAVQTYLDSLNIEPRYFVTDTEKIGKAFGDKLFEIAYQNGNEYRKKLDAARINSTHYHGEGYGGYPY